MPANERYFRELAESIRDTIWIASPDGTELYYVSPAFETLWGRPLQEAYQDPRGWLDAIHPEERERIRSTFFQNARAGGATEEYRVIRPDGVVRWVRNRAYPVRDEGGRIRRLVGIAEDVTEARELSERLTYQASHDPLTGLVNRTEFERRLQRVFETTRGESGEHALCYLDLDRFKAINDTCGHMAGDELLRQLGELLEAQSRKRDTLARLGGDEFGILMEHCALDQARRVANQLHRAIGGFRFRWQDRTFGIGASIGLVPINGASESVTAIWSAADAACYAAKDAGRNRIEVSREEGADPEKRRGPTRWVRRIEDALASDRLRLYYQPIAAVAGGGDERQLSFETMAPAEPPARERIRYELLLRMEDGSGGLVAPGAFLPAAERYDLSAALDRWVIEAAFARLGRDPEHVKRLSLCSINLGRASIRDPRLPAFAGETLAAHGIPADRICFEIAESVAVASLRTTTHCVKALKEAGFRTALDDFGSGPSAFSYLRHLPVDFLKIDGHFVREMLADPVNRVTVRSINDIAHAMGRRTVAKSVENRGTLDALREIGVDYAQGYGLGRPLPVDSLSHPMGFAPAETVAPMV